MSENTRGHPRYDIIYNGKIPFEIYEFGDMRLSKGKFHGPNTKIMDLWFSMDFYGFRWYFLDGILGMKRFHFHF